MCKKVTRGPGGEPGSPEGSSDHGQCDGAEAAPRCRPLVCVLPTWPRVPAMTSFPCEPLWSLVQEVLSLGRSPNHEEMSGLIRRFYTGRAFKWVVSPCFT